MNSIRSKTIRRWLESIHPDDLDSTSEKFRSFVAGEIDQYVSEFRLRTRDGGYRWMLSAGEIVSRDQFGRPLRMVGTHVDISELKQAQLRLRETTERYRILFEQCPDAILIVDIASHRMLESNSAFESILGYSREEALQLTLEDLEAKESPEDVVSHVKQMATRGSDRFETRLRCKDGRVIDVLTHVRAIELGGKKRFHSVLRDITAQKTAERNLRQILESCFGFIGLYDLEGNLIEVNQAPLDVAGLSREEVIGKPVWKSKWWDYSAQSQEQLRDVIKRASLGERVRFESTMRSRQGRFVSVDVVFGPVRNASDQVSHVVSFGVDVTDVKRTQTLLEKSEQFVRSVLDSLDDPLAVIDKEGTVVHANRRWKQTASVSHELIFESEGGSYLATCERKSRDGSQYAFQIASALRSLFNGESVGFSFEYSVERANEVRSYVCRGRRIMTSESVAAKVMHTDVTAIKHAEIERERLLNQLAHAGRVAVMGETTAGVAHELNQPLAAIRLYADNCVAGMTDGTISPPVLRDYLGEIARLVRA